MPGIELNLGWQLALWFVLGLSLLLTIVGAIVFAKDYLESLHDDGAPTRSDIKTRLRSLK